MHSLERLPDCLGWASQREAFISLHSQPGALLGCLDLLLLPSPTPLKVSSQGRWLHGSRAWHSSQPGGPSQQPWLLRGADRTDVSLW